MAAARTYTIRTSPVEAAWQTIQTTGTPAQIERGAHYFAGGRFADIIQLAATLPPVRHLRLVAAA